MTVKIGSRVKFLNDTGEGVVKCFTNNKMAVVETDEGFEMPVLVTDLIALEEVRYGFDGEPASEPDSERNNSKKDKNKSGISFEEKKFLKFRGELVLAFVPENEQVLHVSDIELYVINDSNYYFSFVAYQIEKGIYSLIHQGIVEPDTKINIATFNQTQITKIDEIRIKGMFFKFGLVDDTEPVDLKGKIEGISFYKNSTFRENEYFNEKALIFKKEELNLKKAVEKLSESEIMNVAKIKESRSDDKKFLTKNSSTDVEIDLHIEEIVDSHKDLSNGEILKIQLDRFETALGTAIRGRSKKIVFIHGVGNGKLKYELRKTLDNKYPDLRYQDASFKEYGYGATIVYLK